MRKAPRHGQALIAAAIERQTAVLASMVEGVGLLVEAQNRATEQIESLTAAIDLHGDAVAEAIEAASSGEWS